MYFDIYFELLHEKCLLKTEKFLGKNPHKLCKKRDVTAQIDFCFFGKKKKMQTQKEKCVPSVSASKVVEQQAFFCHILVFLAQKHS